jgi:predicted glycogen debranching enzyme
MSIVDAAASGIDELLSREWLAVNHIGGYACSTPAGLNTRKYHGLLVASLAPPVRRMVLLSRVEESVSIPGEAEPIPLACSEYPDTIHPDGHERLRAFSNEPFPRWVYQADGVTIEKSLRLVHGENTVVLTYTLLGGNTPVTLEVRPLFALRGIHELTYQWNGRLDAQERGSAQHLRIPPTSRTPEVFFAHDGKYEPGGCWYISTIYRRECERGYAGLEDLWMPGAVRWTLSPGQSVHFMCSADPIEMSRVLAEVERATAHAQAPIVAGAATDSALDALLRAAEQFVLSAPHQKMATSKPSINVITQYPWSPPSGRDALIGFTGLLLIPKRFDDAAQLLASMASRLRDGVMPSELPEDGSAAKYNGADTSLWFINAVYNYLRYTNDEAQVRDKFFETVVRIIRCYQAGIASLGVQIDADGLISSHAPGLGTSWMDAKVGDWVITPRQGRTVELNALWYNAVRVAADLSERLDRPSWAAEFTRLAESVRLAFNRRFWNVLNGCCFDVVNDRGADPSIRPNQIFAISLPFPVLAAEHQPAVLQKVRELLCTPYGLRTLAPLDPSYQGHYRGDVVARDRAYHQGCAYPWLLGPLATAMVRVNGRSAQSRLEALKILDGCLKHLQNDGMGQIGELFDGNEPHHPGGGIASARSVGQILRAYVEDVLDFAPQQQRSGVPAPAPPSVQPHVEA